MRILLALTASGSLLALLLLLLKALLGKKLSSTMYYYLWLLVLLRFVLPLPGLVPLGRQVQDTPVQTNRWCPSAGRCRTRRCRQTGL